MQNHNVVVLDYNELVAGVDLTEKIREAFGYDGLGLLTVRNVPNLSQARQALLPLGHALAMLPDDIKRKYEHPQSYYSFGWSHGKEKLQGQPDYSKGSFYANPQFDNPESDQDIISRFPSFVHPNIWPRDELPALEFAFKNLGQLVVSVGQLVARQCDAYVHAICPSYHPSKLFDIISTSRCCKARLLHYFPRSNDDISKTCDDEDMCFSSWCGWHNDHGSLTGLVPGMYIDSLTGQEVENTDPTAGLYIKTRHGQLVKGSIPIDCLGFQIGETAQVHSGGLLQATPHAVRGSNVPNISRETFAVFMEPMYDYPMNIPQERTAEEAQTQQAAASLPKAVPPLSRRWDQSMDFGIFSEKTLSSYY